MKNVLFICLLLITSIAQAQHEGPSNEKRGKHHEKMASLSPEQRADLKTKRMTLSLDLDTNQQNKVQNLLASQEKKRAERKAEKEKTGTKEEKDYYQVAANRLDEQIAFKAEMKSILTTEQYVKFEKEAKRKNFKRRRIQTRKKH